MITKRQMIGGALAGGALVAGCGKDPIVTLTACDVHRAGYPTVAAVKWINEQLTATPDSGIKLRQYPSAQLGAEDDTISLAQSGVIDICRVNAAALNNAFPMTQPLSMPFVIENDDHLHAVVDGPIGQKILDGFEARGLVGLAIYDAGGRCFYNTHRPIAAPKDLKGLKMRVPQSDVFIDSVGAMGANATPLTVSAVFSSLQSRLIDGAENNWPTFETSRHVEVAKFWSQTRHSYSPEFLLMSKLSFDALTPAQQEQLKTLAKQSIPMMRTAWAKTETEARTKALSEGTKVIDVNRDAFRDACKPVIERRLMNGAVAEIYNQVRKLV